MNLDQTDKFCFFYKDDVPDLGRDFVYIKLGEKEILPNPLGHEVIYEADYPDNLSEANPWLWDYSGLYLIYKNGLSKKENILVMHYDNVLVHDWKKRIEGYQGDFAVLGDLRLYEWMQGKNPVTVLPFMEIDKVFNAVRNERFWRCVKEKRVDRVAGFSKFLASRERWQEMMAFMCPFIDHVKDYRPSIAYYAHMLELCWGYYCSLAGYDILRLSKAEVSAIDLYGRELSFDTNIFMGYYEDIVNKVMTVGDAYRLSGLDLQSLEIFKAHSEVNPLYNLQLHGGGMVHSLAHIGKGRRLLKRLLPKKIRYVGLRCIDLWCDTISRFKKRRKAVKFGDLRCLHPVSSCFGFDRGTPIDRHYINRYLCDNADFIKGRVLEIGDNEYTRKYSNGQVVRSDVLHAVVGNPLSTIVGDFVSGEGISGKQFDCMILTQTFLVIYDIQRAIQNCYNALKNGGVLLATVPGISQISRNDMNMWGDYWRFTDASLKRLFGDVFGEENVEIGIYGNVLTACAFLQGLAAEELTKDELDYADPDYQVLLTVKCVKRVNER